MVGVLAVRKLSVTWRRGSSVEIPIRIESDVWEYADIQTIDNGSPVKITAASHGIKDQWRVAVQNAKVLTDLNAENNPPKDSELRIATVVDANSVEFNSINASGMKTHTANTGQLAYYKPLDLSSYTSARMDIKQKVGGAILVTLNTTDTTLEIDSVSCAIWMFPSIEQTLLLPAGEYVFDVEMIDGAGRVVPVCSAESALIVLPEVTTSV